MTPDKARRLRSLTTQLAETLMTGAICAQEIRSVVCSELDEDADVCAGASWTLAPALSRRQHRPIVDESTLSVIWKGKNVYLGNTRELQLLMSLARRPNQFVTHLDLLREVWENEDVATATLRSVVRHLRRRLRSGGMRELADAIRAHRGRYILEL